MLFLLPLLAVPPEADELILIKALIALGGNGGGQCGSAGEGGMAVTSQEDASSTSSACPGWLLPILSPRKSHGWKMLIGIT